MRFSLVSGLVAAVALTDPACALLSPDDIVSDLGGLTDQVKSLGTSALQLSGFAALQYQVAQTGPVATVLAGLDNLVGTIKSDNDRLQLTPQYSDKDANRIATAFTDLVGFEALLISILISKGPDLLMAKDVNSQLLSRLNDVQSSFQTYATSVVSTVPSKVTSITNVLKPFFTLLAIAVKVYTGIFGASS